MTRRHYVALATALGEARPRDQGQLEGWRRAVNAVADVCAFDNPRFDRERFVRATEEDGDRFDTFDALVDAVFPEEAIA